MSAVLSHRIATAVDHARKGDEVVIVVEKLAHVGHLLAEVQSSRGHDDIAQVDRRNGGQQVRFRGGGRIRFAPAHNPDSIRGWTADLFLVDPRVATTTALEQEMRIACTYPDREPQIVRPGDRP